MYGDKLQPSSISLKLRRFTITVSNDGQTRVLRLRPVVLSTLLRSTRELKALGAISHPPRHETLVIVPKTVRSTELRNNYRDESSMKNKLRKRAFLVFVLTRRSLSKKTVEILFSEKGWHLTFINVKKGDWGPNKKGEYRSL